MTAPGSGAGRAAVLAALGANLGIGAAKFVAWAFTGSASMLAEAIHSVADAGNEVLLVVGGHRASRPADSDHEFGYSASRYVYAFIVSVVLFVFGGLFACFEGWHRLTHPGEVQQAGWGFGVLCLSILLESLSLRTALRESRSARAGLGFVAYLRQERRPELPVVLLEDLAALTGLVLALVAFGLAVLTSDGRWDGVGSLAIGIVLVAVAGFLSWRMGSLLIGESVLPEQRQRLIEAIRSSSGVRDVIHLRTLHLGPDEVLVAVKIDVDPEVAVAELAPTIDAVEVRIRAVLPEARYVFVEPDVMR